MAVASVVGSLVSWATVKWGDLNSGSFAFLAPTVSAVYFAAIHYLETKYPKFGWLLGLLPQKKAIVVTPPTPVVPTPAPTPAPTPTPASAKPVAKKAPAKKVAAKKTVAKKAPAKKAVAKKAPAKKATPKKK
jgi:hypothetical protein